MPSEFQLFWAELTMMAIAWRANHDRGNRFGKVTLADLEIRETITNPPNMGQPSGFEPSETVGIIKVL